MARGGGHSTATAVTAVASPKSTCLRFTRGDSWQKTGTHTGNGTLGAVDRHIDILFSHPNG